MQLYSPHKRRNEDRKLKHDMLCAFSFLLLAIYSTEGDAICILFLFIIMLYTMSYLGMIQLSEQEAFKSFVLFQYYILAQTLSFSHTYFSQRIKREHLIPLFSIYSILFEEEMFLFRENKDFMKTFMRIDSIYIIFTLHFENHTTFRNIIMSTYYNTVTEHLTNNVLNMK